MTEAQSAIDVATSERDLLLKQQQEAKDRLAGAQEALAAAKRVAAEKEAEIQQISSDMDAQRCVIEIETTSVRSLRCLWVPVAVALSSSSCGCFRASCWDRSGCCTAMFCSRLP
jgi:hypothetical protein